MSYAKYTHPSAQAEFCGGCVDRFETPAAYVGEKFLCGDGAGAGLFEPELEAMIERCKRTEGCAGVLSFQGEIEDTPLVTTLELTQSVFRINEDASPDGTVLHGIDMYGSSAYFEFRLQLTGIGGILSETSDEAVRALQLSNSVAEFDYDDDWLRAAFRATVAGASVDILASEGVFTFYQRSSAEQRGIFEGAFVAPNGGAGAADDRLEGCFHLVHSDIQRVNRPR
jgi:hypothetical protein